MYVSHNVYQLEWRFPFLVGLKSVSMGALMTVIAAAEGKIVIL